MSALKNTVTIFKDILQTSQPHHISVDAALQRIKTGKSNATIELLRGGDKDQKKKLPVVLWSGAFLERKDSALHDHSGVIVIDLDHVDVQKLKPILSTDEYVFACWVSPSGDGLKALVQVTNPERHRDHFRALQAYFDKQYGIDIDPSGVNESRACFESYDPDIVIKEFAKPFGHILTEQASVHQESKSVDKYTDYHKLNIAARMIRNAPDGEKHATLLKASVLCGGYISAGRMEEDEVIRVLLREISKRDIESEDLARKTILDGIEQGKKLPIREIVEQEDKAQREMLINDGDMSFVSSDDEDFRWINDLAEGKVEIGLDTGNEYFDKFFRFKREFFIINGHSNVGKTTFILYLMVTASMRHGWKWIVYSSENRTASIKYKLMQFVTDMPLKYMNYAQRKMAFEWVQEHFIVISNRQVYSYYDLIIFAEKLIKGQHVDGLFVDPYNSLKIDLVNGSSIGVHEYHYEAASELLTFANAKGIAVWLNTHAVTESQRRIGDDGHPVAPMAADTEGGGKFVNRADGFATVHRKIQHEDEPTRRSIEFHVRKVREVETGGMPTPLYSPISFEMNKQYTSFGCLQGSTSRLFVPLFEQQPAQIPLIPSTDLSEIF